MGEGGGLNWWTKIGSNEILFRMLLFFPLDCWMDGWIYILAGSFVVDAIGILVVVVVVVASAAEYMLVCE